MPDASPAKWHLAHTTWFFEKMILARDPDYVAADAAYDRLFNSYYESVGARVTRAERGSITRPGLEGVLAYRKLIDARIADWLTRLDPQVDPNGPWLFELGLNHEQQHQELILSDILHLLSRSPLCPVYSADPSTPEVAAGALQFVTIDGGVVEIGADVGGFAFDNEQPRHSELLRTFALADRLVTNGEWQAFIDDGGYRRPEFWMADGWSRVQAEGWTGPLYWDGAGQAFGLAGLQPIVATAPVGHVSWFEAEAYARWADARLPTEFEWEHAVATRATDLRQIDSALWQWTASAYAPYPGFRPANGAPSEYNGKFMSGQMVLRGGSFATPDGHSRGSYRNFYYPHQRWCFAGVRLARDV
jgi:ergothioneine biosynthesis protein EgtB